MTLYEDLEKKKDKEILKFLAQEGGARAGSQAGADQTRNRDLAKAVLDSRSSIRMLCLTFWIALLTIVLAILTGILVCQAFL